MDIRGRAEPEEGRRKVLEYLETSNCSQRLPLSVNLSTSSLQDVRCSSSVEQTNRLNLLHALEIAHRKPFIFNVVGTREMFIE